MTSGAAEDPPPAAVGPADAPPGRRRTALLLLLAAAVLALDQGSKALAVRELAGRSVDVVDGVLRLVLVRNPGAAFSIGTGFTAVLTLVALAVVVLIVRTAPRLRSTGWACSLGLVLGGAVGNLTDRLLRPPGPLRGEVVDFLQLPYWPVFNLADTAITLGAVLGAVLTLRGVRLDGTRDQPAAPAADGDGPGPADEAPGVDPAGSRT